MAMDTSYNPPQALTRVWNYPLVQSLANNAVGYYNYAKEYNTYSKKVFETAEAYGKPVVDVTITRLEHYSQQPAVEAIVNRVDQLACNQLDKVEETYTKVKEAGPKAFHAAENAIHGTVAERVLIRTVGVLDSVVEALLPPTNNHNNDNNDDGDDISEEGEIVEERNGNNNQGLVEVTGPVLKKIKTRVSRESVMHLPVQTYTEIRSLALRNAEMIPVLKNCIKLLDGLLASVAAIRNVIQQNTDIAHVFDHSVHRVTSSVNSLVDLLKKIDPTEARVTVMELGKLVAAAKDNVAKVIDNMQLTKKLKEDGSALLLRAGDSLSKPLEAGYVRVANSDIAAIRNTFVLLEAAVQGIITSFSIQAERNRE